ncbi:MAG: hypothetical protein IT384_26165 [Deltaproteobacteria bacterium]|nr:hypothetical protein [Deltaproteobacteria bacterium]
MSSLSSSTIRWAAIRSSAIRWAALAALIVPAAAWARMPPSAAPSSLEISVLTPGGWMVLSDSCFTKKVSTLSLEIPGDVAARGARVRVRLRGHAAAHLDALLLDAAPPVEVKGAPLEKLAALDHDLADARAGVIEARFSSARGEHPRLYVSGRIEPPEIGQLPFLFPPENTLGPMTAGSRFYTYRVGARGGRLTIDGALTAERLGEPFFKEVTRPTSGHPDGVAYGWVMNDAETLYVALDFLSDNTADGEADYAKVYLERDGALREYRVTVSERRWGRAGFVYTPRARHQHKAYELAIPLATVTDQHHDGAPIRIAFALYGTATSGMNGSAPIAFDPTSRRYALTRQRLPAPRPSLRPTRRDGRHGGPDRERPRQPAVRIGDRRPDPRALPGQLELEQHPRDLRTPDPADRGHRCDHGHRDGHRGRLPRLDADGV